MIVQRDLVARGERTRFRPFPVLRPARAMHDLADAVIGRELTKLHEEMVRGRLSELRAAVAGGVRGEVTVLVAGTSEQRVEVPQQTLDEAIRQALDAGRGVRELSEDVARRLGCSRREVYRRALALITVARRER